MSWAWLAIGAGALIVVTRAPLIFRTPETLALYRELWATDARARMLSGLYLALALACFGVAAGTGGIPLQLLVCFGAVLVVVSGWLLAAPAHFRALADRIFDFVEESVDTSAIRGLAAIGTGVGALLVYVGVRAL